MEGTSKNRQLISQALKETRKILKDLNYMQTPIAKKYKTIFKQYAEWKTKHGYSNFRCCACDQFLMMPTSIKCGSLFCRQCIQRLVIPRRLSCRACVRAKMFQEFFYMKGFQDILAELNQINHLQGYKQVLDDHKQWLRRRRVQGFLLLQQDYVSVFHKDKWNIAKVIKIIRDQRNLPTFIFVNIPNLNNVKLSLEFTFDRIAKCMHVSTNQPTFKTFKYLSPYHQRLYGEKYLEKNQQNLRFSKSEEQLFSESASSFLSRRAQLMSEQYRGLSQQQQQQEPNLKQIYQESKIEKVVILRRPQQQQQQQEQQVQQQGDQEEDEDDEDYEVNQDEEDEDEDEEDEEDEENEENDENEQNISSAHEQEFEPHDNEQNDNQ